MAVIGVQCSEVGSKQSAEVGCYTTNEPGARTLSIKCTVVSAKFRLISNKIGVISGKNNRAIRSFKCPVNSRF